MDMNMFIVLGALCVFGFIAPSPGTWKYYRHKSKSMREIDLEIDEKFPTPPCRAHDLEPDGSVELTIVKHSDGSIELKEKTG